MPSGLQSQSTPNLSTANPLRISYADESPSPERVPRTLSPSEDTAPSEPTSLEDPTDDAHLNGDFLSSSSSSLSSSDADDAPPHPTGASRSPQRPSSRSHTHLPPSSSTLFPPFYNRPPTPLPPSPSLTSLLRGGPPFSAAPSRPTTPETSDAESQRGGRRGSATPGTGTPSAAGARRPWPGDAEARPAPPPPPKIPAYEYYGFALYLASAAAFLMFLAWAYLPSALLHRVGVYYFPDRWWALAVPAWMVVAGLWIFVALAAYNGAYLTLRVESAEAMVDECALVAVLDAAGRIVKRRERAPLSGAWPGGKTGGDAAARKGKRRVGHRRHDSRESRKERERDFGLLGKDLDWRALWSEGTDAVMDVPIGGVCEILYGAGRDELQRANE